MLLISAGYVCKKDLRQFRNQEGERTDIGSMSHYLQTKKKIYLRGWLHFNKNQVILRAQQFKTNQKENDFKFLTI